MRRIVNLKQQGMPITVRCAILGHRWGKWGPVGHIESAEWRSCKRGCGLGQMRYV